MNNDFSRIITMLRKEQGKTQKAVAEDLQISQALLSHYEKGTRECSLDFLVKIADYYNVSCDYLLGRSINKKNENVPLISKTAHKEEVNSKNILPMLNKKMISGTINILYEILEEIDSKGLTIEASNYIMITLYQLFRMIYCSNNKNLKSFFVIPEYEYKYSSASSQFAIEGKINAMLNGFRISDYSIIKKDSIPYINIDILNKKYPDYSNSILNLIKNVEKKIINNK